MQPLRDRGVRREDALGGTPQVPQEDIDKIDQWLACGSPNN